MESVARKEGPRILASVIRACGGDFELAEDAVQEAFATALEHWVADGIPSRPDAWIITAARRRAIDQLRRDQTLARKREQIERLLTLEQETRATDTDEGATPTVDDDRLRLIFTCCHPSLAVGSQIALTLRTVAGLDVPGDRTGVSRGTRDDG